MIDGHGDDAYSYADIRLNFSSNVYNHFSHERLLAHLSATMADIAHYPEPVPRKLEAALAASMGICADEVMVTNGATEAIYLTALAWREGHTAIVQPTFTEYADACRLHRHQLVFISHLNEIPPHADTVWLCNPNNPTGTVIPRESLLACLRNNPQTLFVVDASYAPFTAEPLLTPAEAVALTNVVMIHSMTKEFAIPGLRLGYLTACREVLARIGCGRMPWSVNTIAQHAGLYLLAHRSDYRLPLEELLRERQRVERLLVEEGLCDVMPSDTHILLCRLHKGSSAALKCYLAMQRGILIRDASNFVGLDSRFFRIAVQTPAEDDELIEGLRAWHADNPLNEPLQTVCR